MEKERDREIAEEREGEERKQERDRDRDRDREGEGEGERGDRETLTFYLRCKCGKLTPPHSNLRLFPLRRASVACISKTQKTIVFCISMSRDL